MDFGDNVWEAELPSLDDEDGVAAGFKGVRGRRLKRQLGATLSAAVWELEPV